MLFLLQKVLGSKVLLFSVAFFFMGMATINAQYMNTEEASITLKEEIQTLEAGLQGATNQQKLTIAFKHKYFSSVLVDINQGTEVGQAITANRPTNKQKLHSSGMIAFDGNSPTFKAEANALVAYTQGLLAE